MLEFAFAQSGSSVSFKARNSLLKLDKVLNSDI